MMKVDSLQVGNPGIKFVLHPNVPICISMQEVWRVDDIFQLWPTKVDLFIGKSTKEVEGGGEGAIFFLFFGDSFHLNSSIFAT